MTCAIPPITFRNGSAARGCSIGFDAGRSRKAASTRLVGPNGAGKTTCIKILMNLLRASSGHAEVLGHDSRRLSPQDFAQIGYVSENQELPEWMTLEYFLAYLKPFYPDLGRRPAAELRAPVRPSAWTASCRHLSRGMKMKAALASSLAYRPR